MKKLVALVVMCVVIFSWTVPVEAYTAADKFTRGLANVGLSPFELPETMWDEGKQLDGYGIASALTVGVVKGAFNVIKRAAVGAFELVTFPLPVPADYEPILDPPTLFESSDAEDQ